MREILSLYRSEAPERLATIRSSLERSDFAAISKAAHSLANTSGTLESQEAVEVARDLEEAAREEDLERCTRAAGRIEAIVRSLVAEAESFLQS